MFLVVLLRSALSGARRGRWRSSPTGPAHASFMDGLVDAGFIVLGGALADEHRVVHAVEAESEDAVRATFARDPWSETHLRIDTIDPWAIRLDGRRAEPRLARKGDGLVVGDPNMQYALWLAQGLADGRDLELPKALADVEPRAEFLAQIDNLLMAGNDPATQLTNLGRRLRYLAETSASAMRDVPDPLDRIAIALRLWAGCLGAAKTIADATMSGPNSAEERARLFPSIDATAAQDELFCAGVEAAPVFKRLRGQPYFLDGVPDESPVRRHA
jgi:hypothetical protein